MNEPTAFDWSQVPRLRAKLGALAGGCLLLLVVNLWISSHKYARSIVAEVAATKSVPIRIACTGLLGYRNAVELKAELSETVLKKYVSEGDRVRAGDILLKLASTKQKINFEKEMNRLRDAEQEVDKARKEVSIQRELFEKQAVARNSVEKAENDYARAQNNIRLMRQEFQLEQKNFEKTLIVSPTTGFVLLDKVQREPAVEQGKLLFVVGTPDAFQLNGKIDELNIQNLKEGATAEITVDAFPDARLEGVVSRVEAQAEAGSFSKLGVKIDILDAQGVDLKPNLTGQAFIYAGEFPDIMSVPTHAVGTDGDEKFVFVVQPNRKVRKRAVTTGRLAGNRVEITEGLNVGEHVAVSHVDFLHDGEKVELIGQIE